jgi:uncharacterized protein YjbI with pentapeptide repeats
MAAILNPTALSAPAAPNGSADLAESDLTGANLAESDLTGANMSRANLTNANLYRTTCPNGVVHGKAGSSC